MLSNFISVAVEAREGIFGKAKNLDKLNATNVVGFKMPATDPPRRETASTTLDGVCNLNFSDEDKDMRALNMNRSFWHSSDDGAGGMTWLEFFTLYIFAGGKFNIKTEIANHIITLEEAVTEFRNPVLQLVNMAVPALQGRFFRAASNTSLLLQRIRIKFSVGSIQRQRVVTLDRN